MIEKTNIFQRQMTWLRRVTLSLSEQNGNNILSTTIGDFLAPQRQLQYSEQISAIRELCQTLEDKERNHDRIALLKKYLPAGIISGVAVDGIGENNIVARSAVIAIDIDAKDNPALYDWEAVKDAVSKSPFVAYAGLSVSGLGIFVLIPIADPMKHKEHFDAIVDDFNKATFSIKQRGDSEPTLLHGLKLDQAPSNVASKRFVSYDPYPYYNTEAQVYTKTIEPIKLYVRRYTSYGTGSKFDVEAFLHCHNIPFNFRERHGGLQYIVTCPWVELHSSRSKADSAVFVYPDGRPGFKCMHSHCTDKHWQQYREFYEPDAYCQRGHTFPRLSDIMPEL